MKNLLSIFFVLISFSCFSQSPGFKELSETLEKIQSELDIAFNLDVPSNLDSILTDFDVQKLDNGSLSIEGDTIDIEGAFSQINELFQILPEEMRPNAFQQEGMDEFSKMIPDLLLGLTDKISGMEDFDSIFDIFNFDLDIDIDSSTKGKADDPKNPITRGKPSYNL